MMSVCIEFQTAHLDLIFLFPENSSYIWTIAYMLMFTILELDISCFMSMCEWVLKKRKKLRRSMMICVECFFVQTQQILLLFYSKLYIFFILLFVCSSFHFFPFNSNDNNHNQLAHIVYHSQKLQILSYTRIIAL